MALSKLNQYENLIFPDNDILVKAIENTLESLRHFKESHIDVMQLDNLNRKFNDFVEKRAKESLKMSMDLDDFTIYFRMLTEDNVTVNDFLKTLLMLKDVTENKISSSEELIKEFEKIKEIILTYINKNTTAYIRQSSKYVQPNLLFKSIPILGSTYSLTSYSGLPGHYIALLTISSIPLSYYILNRKKGTTMINNEEEQKKVKKYGEKISINLPVISTHLETSKQFLIQLLVILGSQISELKSMNGDANLKLSKNLATVMIERYTEEMINCKKCNQNLNGCVFKYRVSDNIIL